MRKAKYILWHTDNYSGTNLIGDANTIKDALSLMYSKVKEILAEDKKWGINPTNTIHIKLKEDTSVKVFECTFSVKEMPKNVLYYEDNILYEIKYGSLSTKTKRKLWAL